MRKIGDVVFDPFRFGDGQSGNGEALRRKK